MAEELGKLTQQDRIALVFIHGYRVGFEAAAIRAAQLGVDLDVPLTAFFSWPSQATFAGYAADAASIESSEILIADFLINFTEKSGAESVHVIAHSMGNRALLRSFERIARHAVESAKIPFGQIILAAPDIDATVFKNLALAHSTIAKRTTLYASSKDEALKKSGQLHCYNRAGFLPPVTVVSGIDTIDVSAIDLSLIGHGYVGEHRDVLRDIYALIRYNRTLPYFCLSPALTKDDEPYWRFEEADY